jgi:hypothetical protein
LLLGVERDPFIIQLLRVIWIRSWEINEAKPGRQGKNIIVQNIDKIWTT